MQSARNVQKTTFFWTFLDLREHHPRRARGDPRVGKS
jgi:hypothetical protein